MDRPEIGDAGSVSGSSVSGNPAPDGRPFGTSGDDGSTRESATDARHSGTVLVTGGCGYLGSLVVRRLAERGVPTVALDRRPPHEKRDGADYVISDLRDADFAALLTERDVSAVVHLAAIVEPPPEMTDAALESIEVGGTERVVEACVAAGVGHLTVTSSGAAYGYHARNDGRLLREDEPAPGSDNFAYSRHKAAVERLLAKARRLHPELAQLVLRPGTILGTHTNNQITALFTGRAVINIGRTGNPFTFIWDEDVAEVIVRGVLSRRTGIYNVSGDGVLTMPEIAAIEGTRVVRVPAGGVRTALRVLRRFRLGRYGPEQVDFLAHRPVMDITRLQRDFPGMPSKTTREVYDVFRSGRHRQKRDCA